MNDVNRAPSATGRGDSRATDPLLPMVYDDLRAAYNRCVQHLRRARSDLANPMPGADRATVASHRWHAARTGFVVSRVPPLVGRADGRGLLARREGEG
jgi:hypothetical protein